MTASRGAFSNALPSAERLEFAEVPAGQQAPALSVGCVHVWYFLLSPPEEALLGLRALLSASERARADRFFRSIHQRRFTAGRALLRQILASYLGTRPNEVAFEYGPNGKPCLSGSELQFNLSHTGDIGVCAIARSSAIGVDLEYLQEKAEYQKIARRFFAEREYEQLLQLPESARLAGFYQCWTAKEALIKAWGLGLSAPLHQFSVQVSAGHTELESVRIEPYASQAWTVAALPAPNGLVASLALDTRPSTIEVGTIARFPAWAR